MKIGFVNFSPMEYDVETPYIEPLGGSESALCYLVVALASRGHEVSLFWRRNTRVKKLGVHHINVNDVALVDLDVLVVQNSPDFGKDMRTRLPEKTKLVLWSQHASDQVAVASLHGPEVQLLFDRIVLLSEWQKAQYITDFGVDPQKIVLIGNAISPAFENAEIAEKVPDSMAYTSTPFRGLSLLGEIFEQVRGVRPQATAHIFSSMKVYQLARDEFVPVYKKLKKLKGVQYHGSLSQKALSEQLRTIESLAYPNLFPETSCIAVMEAMALGLRIVTSDLGALPETTAGYAQLVPILGRTKGEYMTDFVDTMLKPIQQEMLKDQVKFVNLHYTWKVRAEEWERELKECVY